MQKLSIKLKYNYFGKINNLKSNIQIWKVYVLQCQCLLVCWNMKKKSKIATSVCVLWFAQTDIAYAYQATCKCFSVKKSPTQHYVRFWCYQASCVLFRCKACKEKCQRWDIRYAMRHTVFSLYKELSVCSQFNRSLSGTHLLTQHTSNYQWKTLTVVEACFDTYLSNLRWHVVFCCCFFFFKRKSA